MSAVGDSGTSKCSHQPHKTSHFDPRSALRIWRGGFRGTPQFSSTLLSHSPRAPALPFSTSSHSLRTGKAPVPRKRPARAFSGSSRQVGSKVGHGGADRAPFLPTLPEIMIIIIIIRYFLKNATQAHKHARWGVQCVVKTAGIQRPSERIWHLNSVLIRRGFFMPNTACNKVGDERDNAGWEIAALLCAEYIPLFA